MEESTEMKNDQNDMMDEDTREYEVSFHLLPTLSKEAADAVVEEIISFITTDKGAIISQGKIEPYTLAYSISKSVKSVKSSYSRSYFGWVKFSCSGERVVALKDMLQKSDSVLRFLIVHAVTEKEDKKEVEEENAVKKEKMEKPETAQSGITSEEELDKTIDQLVIN
jgi:ribosomal protein S6